MARRFSDGDVSAFKLLLAMAALYGLVSCLVYSVLHLRHVKPLDLKAPVDRFSEARAMEHVIFLSQGIDGRQEGRSGLKEASQYIKSQLELLKGRAGENVRVEIEEDLVDGSFNMVFLGHSISLGYRNHTNILARVSSIYSEDGEPAVLVNSHYDGPLNSPGASDCGSCVASMLEIARLLVDSNWVPPKPIIFLFNGAEELFLLGSHGFMQTNKWRDSIGAFINVEASGTGSPDLLCQSGPGSWPSEVYASSAIYPMANSAAQDVFPIVPGDTDFRIFAEGQGEIPGLDVIFMLGGYFYHTSYDTVDRLVPGSIQARGENLWSVIKALSNSPNLQNVTQRSSNRHGRPVFFDYLTWFMIFYKGSTAMVLHSLPVAVFFLMPLLLNVRSLSFSSYLITLWDFTKGMMLHALAILLGVLVPVLFSILRLFFSNQAMCWFARPYLAYLMFIPCSLIGLLSPKLIWFTFPLSRDISSSKKSKQKASQEAIFWGAFGFYGFITLAYLIAGLGGGFLCFLLSASMLPARLLFCISASKSGSPSLRSLSCHVVPLVPGLVYAAYFCGFLVQFLVEKTGMMGSLPPPYGLFAADALVAAAVGVVTAFSVGPTLPACQDILGRSSVLRALVQLSVVSLALSSRCFPYSVDAPKRVVFQHTRAAGSSSYDFAVVDSNSLSFLFENSPGLSVLPSPSSRSSRDTWLALFPVSYLLSGSIRYAALEGGGEIEREDGLPPRLSLSRTERGFSSHTRRVHLQLYLGSLRHVWVAVVNVTGPVSNWSFAGNTLPAAETVDGGPPSYVCRLSGNSKEGWDFWIEAGSEKSLMVEVAVLDQHLVESALKIKRSFPEWVDVVAFSTFVSTHFF